MSTAGRQCLATLACLLFGVALPNAAIGGNNGSAVARLSWAADSVVADRTSLPVGDFPLYILIDGALDVATVATHVKWNPAESWSGCYSLMTGHPDSTCGYEISESPEWVFGGDSSYTWTIVYPAVGRSCIAVWFSSDSCGQIAPANFCLHTLRLTDSEGNLDDVPVLAGATILGGVEEGCGLAVQSPSVGSLVPGATTELSVHGSGFADGAVVSVTADGAQVEAQQTTTVSSELIEATIAIPEQLSGPLDLVVELPDQRADTLRAALVARDTSSLNGDGLNTEEWPIDRLVPGGVMRKDPGASTWYFVPGITDRELEMLSRLEPSKLQARLQELTRRPLPASHLGSVRAGGHPRLEGVDGDTLMLERFDAAQSLPSGWIASSGSLASPVTWGVATVGDGCPVQTFQGVGRSAHCAASMRSSFCTTYDYSEVAVLRGPWTDIQGYVAVTLSLLDWIDASNQQQDPESPFSMDGFFWGYSVEGAFGDTVNVFVNSGAPYSGARRAWEGQGIILSNVSGDTLRIRPRVVFSSFTTREARTPPWEGVYVDNFLIVGRTQVDLSSDRPSSWSAPLVLANSPGANSTLPSLLANQKVYASLGIRNVGQSASTVSTLVRFYVDETARLDVSVPPLGPNQPYTIRDAQLAASYFPCGAHTIRAIIDPDGLVDLGNRGNNQEVHGSTWLPSNAPDLVVTNIDVWPPAVMAGEEATVTVTVRNQGSAGSGQGFRVALFRNRTTKPVVGEVGDYSALVGALAAGASASVQFQVTSAVATTWHMYAFVDALANVTEPCAEDKNDFGPEALTWSAPRPDLVVAAIVATPSVAFPGQAIDVAVRVMNQGSAATSNADVQLDFYSNLPDPPVPGTPGFFERTLLKNLTLLPEHSIITHYSVVSNEAATWSMYAAIDATDAVDEAWHEDNNVNGPRTVEWTYGAVTISGTLAYDDTSFVPSTGPQHPMRCVPVTLFDSDGGNASNNWAPDDSLAVTATDANGRFSFPPVLNRDDTDQGRLDLYVRVQAKNDVTCVGNPVVAVKDSSLTRCREWRSTAMNDVANGTVPLGTLKPTDYASRATFHLYDTIFKGYDWALARGLAPPEGAAWYCEVVWQPGYVGPYSFTTYAGRMIHVVGEPTLNPLTPDEWDDGVILHEYGHFLADLFHFEPMIPDRPPDGCPHDPTMQAECPPGTPSAQFAWSEGWPHYFACVTQSTTPTPTRRNTGARKSGNNWTDIHWYEMNIETGGNSQDNGIPLVSANDGMLYEVANAGVLWDIYDSIVDNQNGDSCSDGIVDGFDHAWNVTANHPGNANWNLGFFYRLYWERYTQANPTLDQLLTEVYCEHGIPVSGGSTVSAPGLANLRLALGVAPNPARGPVLLTYAIPADLGNATVEIGVFDVAGRLVRRLQRGFVGPGTHQIAWSGEDDEGNRTRSGMYFCRLIVADQKRLLGFVVVR